MVADAGNLRQNRDVRSRSRSLESMTRSTCSSLTRKIPLWLSMASTSVVLPWSTWAMMAILRIEAFGDFIDRTAFRLWLGRARSWCNRTSWSGFRSIRHASACHHRRTLTRTARSGPAARCSTTVPIWRRVSPCSGMSTSKATGESNGGRFVIGDSASLNGREPRGAPSGSHDPTAP